MQVEGTRIFIESVLNELSLKGSLYNRSMVENVLLEVTQKFDIVTKGEENHDTRYLELFLTAKRVEGRTLKTIERYKYILTRLLEYCNISVEEITIFHLRKYFTAMQEKGISDRTLEGERQVFSSFFSWLFRERIILSNPCDNLHAIKYEKKIRKPFTDVEIEKMKECCSTSRDKAIISFLLSSGCRINEVCTLKRSQIDLQRKECTVLGKGKKQRKVYLNDITCMLLSRYFNERKDQSDFLFAGRGNTGIQSGGIRAMLKSIEKRSGVENIHPHRFRRTLATNLIKHGMSIQEVAHILGHDKIDTTMEYVYIDDSSVKSSYAKYA